MILAAYAASLAVGYRIARLILDRPSFNGWSCVFLAPALGFGFTTAVLFILFNAAGHFSKGLLSAAWALHAAAFVFLWRTKPASPVVFPGKAAFAAVLALGLGLASFKLAQSPFGSGLDAWALWKLKARFLMEDARVWEGLFRADVAFSCRDYPLFYPLSIAWGWMNAGRETPVAGWALALIFTLSIAGLCMSFFAEKDIRTAWASGLFLISAPAFIGVGTSQYADIVMAYFNLASAAALAVAWKTKEVKASFAAGLLLGMGAFVKNEGMLFLAAAAVLLRLDRKPLTALLAGLAPFLIMLFIFKFRAGLPNEKINSAQLTLAIQEGRFFLRWPLIVKYAWQEFSKENSWIFHWFFIAAAVLKSAERMMGVQKRLLALGLLLAAGYFAVYIVSPLEVEMNLRTSIDRVFVHVFPVWTLLAFLCWRDAKDRA